MDIFIVLLLILTNGLFAMAEIAIISAKKSYLQQRANKGDKNARTALEMANSPSRFLSTVQVGIALIGILAGAFGGATIAGSLTSYFNTIPSLAPYSQTIALVVVVSTITYLSLIIGELVPKRIALSNPEKIASLVARPMNTLARITSPIVSVLSSSTEIILNIAGIKEPSEPPVTDEEVRVLLREGTKTGAFELAEKDIVERTMRLSDKKVKSFMTSRKEIVWLDIDSSFKTIRNKIVQKPHSHFPVCRKNLDRVVGVVRTENLLVDFLDQEKINLQKQLEKPLFVPESMDGLKLFELFKKSGIHIALIADEYGNTEGLVSITDIIEEIVGDIPAADEREDKEITKRNDGSFLVDGLVSVEEFKEFFKISSLPGEKTGTFHTVGGFVTTKIGKIPTEGNKFEHAHLKFEVLDMDGTRVDKILVTPQK